MFGLLDHQNTVAEIVDSLRAAASGQDVAWALSNALDRMRHGFKEPLAAEERDELLRCIADAHAAALVFLPDVSPVQLALGFGAVSARIMLGCVRRPAGALGLSLDLHDRVRIFQSQLDVVARERDIATRSRPACAAHVELLLLQPPQAAVVNRGEEYPANL